MSDELLRSIYQEFQLTQSPEVALQFMAQYMRQIGDAPPLPTAQELDTQTWVTLALAQGWRDPAWIVSKIIERTSFIYGYQCPCGQVFLNSELEEAMGGEDEYIEYLGPYGRGCDKCDQVYCCGECSNLIILNGSTINLYLCVNCFSEEMAEAIQTGGFSIRDLATKLDRY